MNVSLAQNAAALNANSRWQEVIAENLASSSIPGYKRQDLTFSAIQGGIDPSAAPNLSKHWSLPKADTATSFQQGELKYTGVKTDVAIDGPGFFEVQLADGRPGYTRDGEFGLNSEGQLVTKQGYLVMGDTGPIQFDRNISAPISISPSGEVVQGTDRRGTLSVVSFNQPQLLTAAGGSLFIANNVGLRSSQVTTPSIRQGFLESANTSPVQEMANLISVMRTFEANQKSIQAHDDRMSRAITELGNPN